MKKRMAKVNLLSELELCHKELRCLAAVLVYGLQGGDLTKPIEIETLGQMPVRRLYGEDVEVDGKKAVRYGLRPVRHATGPVEVEVPTGELA